MEDTTDWPSDIEHNTGGFTSDRQYAILSARHDSLYWSHDALRLSGSLKTRIANTGLWSATCMREYEYTKLRSYRFGSIAHHTPASL